MNTRHLAAVAILLLLVGSITLVSLTQSDNPESPTQQTASSNDGPPTESGGIYLEPKSSFGHNRSGDPDPLLPEENYHVNLTIVSEVYGYDNLTYEKVMICVYDQNGTLLHNDSLGKISSQSRQSNVRYVNMSFDQAPKYFIVDHPKMRTDERVRSDPLVWRNDTRSPHWDYLRNGFEAREDDFEWPRSSEVGTCG